MYIDYMSKCIFLLTPNLELDQNTGYLYLFLEFLFTWICRSHTFFFKTFVSSVTSFPFSPLPSLFWPLLVHTCTILRAFFLLTLIHTRWINLPQVSLWNYLLATSHYQIFSLAWYSINPQSTFLVLTSLATYLSCQPN